MSKTIPLLDDESDDEVDFSINKGYAENYDKWRKKEEMMKLKALGEELSESSSSSEEETEPIIEKDFLKTLSLIKSKDPVIYNENVTFFKDEGIPKKPKEKKEKSMFIKNYEAELVMKTEGRSSDEEEDDRPPKPDSKELAELAKSFKTAVDSDDEEGGEGGLFAVKSKTKQEEDKEEEEHLKWLKGQKKEIDKETEKELSFLRKYWNDTKLDAGEKFLKDYLLNQRYLDSNAEDVPSYEQIEEELQQEDETIAQQEQFEEKYNFRFEEPDPEFIKRYPRTIGDSLRREDNRRKAKREEREQRKKRDKEQMKEELKRLKALKRKEIEEKFFKLKEASGKDEINFDESDIESDFDPDKHDEKMKELFNDDYYAKEEEQKPEFLYDAEIDDEDWDHWTREQAKQGAVSEGADCEEKEESSSSEVEEAVDRKAEFEQEMIESTRTGRRKGKKKSLFAQLLAQPKPLYDPDGKSFQEYLDEYYNLDYEDVIGDLPVKFKYRKVIPNDFGLTTDEILTANDKELNRWCSVKKTCQYRRDEEEIYEVQAFKKKAENIAVKKKILTSVYAPPEENSAAGNESNNAENSDKPKKKRRRKKKKSLNGIDSELNLQNESMETATDPIVAETAKDMQSREVQNKNDTENESKKKRSRKRKKKSLNGLGDEQINLQNESIDAVDHVEAESTNETQCSVQKKKKRKFNPSEESNQDPMQNTSLGDGSAFEDASTQELNDGSFKKKKHKKSLSLEENNINSTLSPDENVIQTSNSIKKKKDKHLLSQADTDVDNSFEPSEPVFTGENSPMKKKRKQSDSNHLPQEGQVSGEPSENNQGQSKKKKHKKNFDACATSHESSIQITDRDSSFHSQNNFTNKREKSGFHNKKSKKNKQKPFKPQSSAAQSDKRLSLSDSRLAAFGINPKKFKNKIKYSQK